MPRRPSDEPLIKVTLNLFIGDVEFLKERLGWGYTELIRAIVSQHVREIKQRELLDE